MTQPKSIFITGASSGIGEALAHAYASDGVTLYITGRNEERLQLVKSALEVKGAQVHAKCVDVTDQIAMKDWMNEMWLVCPFDLVIANAGISGGSGTYEDGEPVDQARKIFDVNLTGVLNTIEPVLDKMIARGQGQIAIISSLAAFRGWPGAPAYSASKGAVRFYGEALRGSIMHTGVKVNVVCPGFVVSRMTDQNSFSMPFLMKTDKAVQIIKSDLEKNKGRIAFPFPSHVIAWLLSILPDFIAQRLLGSLPQKE